MTREWTDREERELAEYRRRAANQEWLSREREHRQGRKRTDYGVSPPIPSLDNDIDPFEMGQPKIYSEGTMNNSKQIFLVSDKVRQIAVAYQPSGRKDQAPEVTYFKTMNPDIAVDDLVVIPTDTRWNHTVVKVIKVDIPIDDFDGGSHLKWILDKVDTSAAEATIEKEKQMLEQIQVAERQRRQRELKEKLLESAPDVAAITFNGS